MPGPGRPGPERPEPVPERPEPGRVPVPAPGPAVPAAGRTRPAGLDGARLRGPGAARVPARGGGGAGDEVLGEAGGRRDQGLLLGNRPQHEGRHGVAGGRLLGSRRRGDRRASGLRLPTSTARSARVALSRGGSGAAAGASAGAGATWAAGLGVGTCAGAGAAVSNRCGCPAYVLDPSTWIRSGITYPIRSSRTVARTGCPAARVRRCRWFRTASSTDSPVPATTGMPPTVAPPPGPRSGSRCAGTGTRTSIGVTVAPVRAVDTAPAAERLRLCSRWSRDIVPHSGRSARARWAGGGLPGTVRSLGRKIPVRVRC